MSLFQLVIIFLSPQLIKSSTGVKVNIDGKINLGTQWVYQFYPITLENNLNKAEQNEISKHETKHHLRMPEAILGTERYTAKTDERIGFDDVGNVTEKTENIKGKRKVKPYKIKNDAQISSFIVHVYKQAMNVFDSIKDKTESYLIKEEVDALSRTYEEKFEDFVKETQEHVIKTKLGKQKTIINTMDTSNAILKRLINYLTVKVDTQEMRKIAASNVLQNLLDKKIEMDNAYVCTKFSICRSQNGFGNFVADLLNIIISSSDRKIKEVSDAITEELKNIDINNDIMDNKHEKMFQKDISTIEIYVAAILKPIYQIMKNLIVSRNKPIEVVGETGKRVDKTVAFLEIQDDFESVLPPDKTNTKKWNAIKLDLKAWSDGHKQNVQTTVRSFFAHLQNGIDKMDQSKRSDLKSNLKLLLGYN